MGTNNHVALCSLLVNIWIILFNKECQTLRGKSINWIVRVTQPITWSIWKLLIIMVRGPKTYAWGREDRLGCLEGGVFGFWNRGVVVWCFLHMFNELLCLKWKHIKLPFLWAKKAAYWQFHMAPQNRLGNTVISELCTREELGKAIRIYRS